MNFVYPKARQAFAAGDLDWDAHTFKVQPVTSAYAPGSTTTDDFLNDIASGSRVGALSPALAGKTNANGTLDADDVTIAELSAAGTITAIVLVRDTGSEATSQLVAYIDTVSAGLPFTPDGSDFVIMWAAAGILTI